MDFLNGSEGILVVTVFKGPFNLPIPFEIMYLYRFHYHLKHSESKVSEFPPLAQLLLLLIFEDKTSPIRRPPMNLQKQTKFGTNKDLP